MKLNSSQKFSRFEMKYIINEATSKMLQDEIKNFMIHDGFVNIENYYLA